MTKYGHRIAKPTTIPDHSFIADVGVLTKIAVLPNNTAPFQVAVVPNGGEVTDLGSWIDSRAGVDIEHGWLLVRLAGDKHSLEVKFSLSLDPVDKSTDS